MKVQIVSYEHPDKWILGKFARKMTENLSELGIDVTLGRAPDPDADVNHHICYVNYEGFSTGTNTLMVTHVDSIGLLRMLGRQLETADLAICMSSHTMRDLLGVGLQKEKLCYINPAHDGIFVPRRLRIGIMTRLYDDGRKNEAAFLDMLRRLPQTDLHFVIMGNGWEVVIDQMRELRMTVDFYPRFDLERYRELMPTLDYYVYFGHDEGSMGFVDAVAAGVDTIVTPQGYHLDVEGGITHSIESLDDLAATLVEIAATRRRRTQAVAGWTWRRYAEKHLDLWLHLSGQGVKANRNLGDATGRRSHDGLPSLRENRDVTLQQKVRFLSRLSRTSLWRRLKILRRIESTGQ